MSVDGKTIMLLHWGALDGPFAPRRPPAGTASSR